MISGETRLACVIGNPVKHSKSPILHNAAFRATGIDARYLAFEIDEPSKAIGAMRSLGFLGMNVTMPFKSQVAGLVDELSPAAKILESVNLVFWQDGKLIGDSTDGTGFVRAFESKFSDGFAGKKVAVIGAGGAARSILSSLGTQSPKSLSIVNRTEASAERAASLVSEAKVGDDVSIADADIVINTTSVGMSGTDAAAETPFDVALLSSKQTIVDIVYSPKETPLLRAAAAAGCRVQGGLPMLVHQAALSFEAWTQTAAPIEDMLAAVQKAL